MDYWEQGMPPHFVAFLLTKFPNMESESPELETCFYYDGRKKTCYGEYKKLGFVLKKGFFRIFCVLLEYDPAECVEGIGYLKRMMIRKKRNLERQIVPSTGHAFLLIHDRSKNA